MAFTWGQLVVTRPTLAEAGERLFYQFGTGLAFIATVGSDGSPSVYRFAPLIADGGLFALLECSFKRGDLHDRERYALHTYPSPDNDDAFSLTGRAALLTDVQREDLLRTQYLAERELDTLPRGFDEYQAFELFLDRCTQTASDGHGDPEPHLTTWYSPSPE